MWGADVKSAEIMYITTLNPWVAYPEPDPDNTGVGK